MVCLLYYSTWSDPAFSFKKFFRTQKANSHAYACCCSAQRVAMVYACYCFYRFCGTEPCAAFFHLNHAPVMRFTGGRA